MAQKVMAIAESINIMGKRSGTAMKERVAGPIQEMARGKRRPPALPTLT